MLHWFVAVAAASIVLAPLMKMIGTRNGTQRDFLFAVPVVAVGYILLQLIAWGLFWILPFGFSYHVWLGVSALTWFLVIRGAYKSEVLPAAVGAGAVMGTIHLAHTLIPF